MKFNLFSRKKEQNATVTNIQLVQRNGNTYMSWRGALYESDIVLACIAPKVKEIGKLVGKHIRKTVVDGKTQLSVNPSFNIRMLLEEPNELMTGQELQEKMAMQLCLNSNAYALIKRNADGEPIAIYPIVPVSVTATYKPELYLKFTMQNGTTQEYPYTDIIHLRDRFNENDVFGTPIAPALIPLLTVVKTTDEGVINAIKNSSIVRWLLKFSNPLRPEDLKQGAKDFSENFLSTADGVGVAAVDSKADAQQINPTDYVPNASQMDRTTQRIFAVFNTNLKIVTGTANEDERQSYFDSECEPVLLKLNGEYTRKLFTRNARAYGNEITFEASAWDGASLKTKLGFVALVDRGCMTPNEWRLSFNLAPVDGGDDLIMRLDTAKIGGEGGNEDEDNS